MYKIINRKKLWATILLDSLGKAVFWPWSLLRKADAIPPEEIKEILLIRTAYIGDVVMTLPMLRPLKERFLQSRITFLTAPGAVPLLQTNPFVDEIIPFAPFWFYSGAKNGIRAYVRCIRSLRQRRFDLLIEARGDIREILLLAAPIRSRFKVSYGIGGGAYLLTHEVPYKDLRHKVEYHLDICRFLGCPETPLEWDIYLAESEKGQARHLLNELGVQPPYICAHPGSRLALKRWPPEHCATLYDLLLERFRCPLLLFGTAEDRGLIEQIMADMQGHAVNLAGRMTLREMAAVLAQASLFVCNDSAPMHIAAALKVPTVALFGPSKSIETGPFGPRSQAVEKDFPCRFSCDESSCAKETEQECLRTITPEAVLQAAEHCFAYPEPSRRPA